MEKAIKNAVIVFLIISVFFCAACGPTSDDTSGTSAGISTTSASTDGEPEKEFTTYTFNATMYSGIDKINYGKRQYVYDGRVFDCKSTEFSAGLAEFLLQSAAANQNLKTIKEYFDNAGFDNAEYYNYDTATTKDSVAFTIAHKKEGDTDMIETSIRGFIYNYEWAGNFDCGAEGDYHYGFYVAAQKVYDGLVAYIEKYAYNPVNCKFLITGYSRAGSIAMIVGCKINSEYNRLLPREKVYVYTFEAPPCVNKAPAYTKNIFNVVSHEDFITYLFPPTYGFKRVGTDIDIFREDYADLLKEHFGLDDVAYYGGLFYESAPLLYLSSMALLGQEVDKDEYVSLNTRADYCENAAQVFGDAFLFVYMMPAAKRTTFAASLKELLGEDGLSAITEENVLYDAVKASANIVGVIHDIEHDRRRRDLTVGIQRISDKS